MVNCNAGSSSNSTASRKRRWRKVSQADASCSNNNTNSSTSTSSSSSNSVRVTRSAISAVTSNAAKAKTGKSLTTVNSYQCYSTGSFSACVTIQSLLM
jgi:hypothetical protein